MKKKQKMLSVLALLSLTLTFAGCSTEEGKAGQEQANPTVKVITLGSTQANGAMVSGKVAPNQEVQVVSKISGRVASVNVEEGAVVKQGDVLVQLESDDYVQQVNQAKAGISGASAKLADTKAGTRAEELHRLKSNMDQQKSALDNAQKNFDRIKNLFDSGAVSQNDLDNAQLNLDRAKSTYEQAKDQYELSQAGATGNTIQALQAEVDRSRSALELAQLNLSNTTIKSPISGIVAKRSIDPGELAQPGAPLITVVEMNPVQVQLSVNQDQVNQVKQGSTVQIKGSALGDKSFTGTVTFVSPVSDATSATFPVKVKVDNPDGLLRAGMIVDASLATTGEPRLELPKAALVNKDQKTYVYQLTGDTVHLLEVSTEDKNGEWVYVNSGLKANDQVVINPSEQLTDGGKVSVK